jgi:hypothetical protein
METTTLGAEDQDFSSYSIGTTLKEQGLPLPQQQQQLKSP